METQRILAENNLLEHPKFLQIKFCFTPCFLEFN